MGRHNSCVSLLVSAKRLVFSALTDVEPEPVAMSDQVQELAPMPIPKGLSVEPDGMERFPINPPPSEVDFPSVGLLDFLDTSCSQALPLPLVSFDLLSNSFVAAGFAQSQVSFITTGSTQPQEFVSPWVFVSLALPGSPPFLALPSSSLHLFRHGPSS